MNRDDLAHYLALDACPGIGPARFRQLCQSAELTLRDLALLSGSQLQALGFSPLQVEALQNPPQELIENTRRWLEADPGHHILAIDDQDYPELLKQISDPPGILYTLGDRSLLSNPQIAIVGSRNPTAGGAALAREFAAHLTGCGLTITSGLASGIDAAAHRGALDANGSTLAVTVPAAGVAAGNSIIVSFAMGDVSGAVSCSDGTNTYSVDFDVTNNNNVRTVVLSAHNVTALSSGATITVTHPSTTDRAMTVAEFTSQVPWRVITSRTKTPQITKVQPAPCQTPPANMVVNRLSRCRLGLQAKPPIGM